MSISDDVFTIPLLSTELILKLDLEFPHRCPTLKMSEREIYLYAGKREIVEFLLSKLKEQEENLLENANVYVQ